MSQDNAARVAQEIALRFVDREGQVTEVLAEAGQSLMEVATAYGISGIDGDCGGCCACGTCRMELPAALLAQLPPAQDEERALLDFLDDAEAQRLGCQIEVAGELDGCTIRVATD